MNTLIEQVTRNFRHTDLLHRRVLDKHVSESGVFPGQHRLLMFLSKKSPISQKEIAKEMDVSPASIATSLKKLEKVGYIKKDIDQTDNRYNNIEITDSGRRIVKKGIDLFSYVDEVMFEGFSNEELEQMLLFLDKMYVNLTKLEKE